ncbi:MAG: transcriptional repressor [Paludibacter sp.]|nr:transcriptional repressor [Paludibacter sp.]
MENSEYLDRLKKRGIKPTSLRVLILRTMMHENRAVSILDIESELETVDKSTIFRTVTLFLSHHLIHSIDDGSGSLKYAVCGNSCTCAVEDLHSHFYCNSCHKTYCLEGIDVPVVELPVGFSLQSINYVLKGICFVCSSKNKS